MGKNVAVRYCSKTPAGNTRKIAQAIALGAGVEAVSILDERELTQAVDTLFLGGAPYANIMSPELREYAEKLSVENVKEVYLFTTSNWSRRTVYALKKILRKKGIKVHAEYFYAHMLHISARQNAAEEFGRRHANFQ